MQTGTILNTNVTVVAGGQTLKNQVEADYKTIPGDSGAAVAYYRYVGGGTSDYAVMGIHSSTLLDENKNWVPGYSKSYFSRIDYIFQALNLSSL